MSCSGTAGGGGVRGVVGATDIAARTVSKRTCTSAVDVSIQAMSPES